MLGAWALGLIGGRHAVGIEGGWARHRNLKGIWVPHVPFLHVGSLTGQLYLNWHSDQLFPRTPPATVSLESVAMIVQAPHAFNRPNNPHANTTSIIAPAASTVSLPFSVSLCLCGKPAPAFRPLQKLSILNPRLSTAIFRPKSSIFNKLQTLCRFQKTQLLCYQANTNSSTETPGVGGMQCWLPTQLLHGCRMNRA